MIPVSLARLLSALTSGGGAWKGGSIQPGVGAARWRLPPTWSSASGPGSEIGCRSSVKPSPDNLYTVASRSTVSGHRPYKGTTQDVSGRWGHPDLFRMSRRVRCQEVLHCLPKLRAHPRRLVAGTLNLHPFELRQAHFQPRMGSMIVVKASSVPTDPQTHAVKHSMFQGAGHCSSAFELRSASRFNRELQPFLRTVTPRLRHPTQY
jgi:hypothetical protein